MNEAYGSIIELEHIIMNDYHMKFSDAPIIYADNQASIGIVVNQAELDRSRQFQVIHHRLHDAIDKRDLLVVKIDSSRNHADIGTKSLDGPDHHRHVAGLGLISTDDLDSDSN
jgi:riboflavin synthase